MKMHKVHCGLKLRNDLRSLAAQKKAGATKAAGYEGHLPPREVILATATIQVHSHSGARRVQVLWKLALLLFDQA